VGCVRGPRCNRSGESLRSSLCDVIRERAGVPSVRISIGQPTEPSLTADAPSFKISASSTRIDGNAREMCLMLEPIDHDQLCMLERSEPG
jgi:hypothetical protein